MREGEAPLRARARRLATRAFLAGFVGLAPAERAVAHDTWLAPRLYRVGVGVLVLFDLTSHDAFPALDHAVAPDRIARSGLRLGGKTTSLPVVRRGAKSLELQASFATAGIALAFVELKPRRLELLADKVAEYLKDIGGGAGVADDEASRPPHRRWREEYRKLAKTILRAGEADDGAWAEPLGLDLELVPESDPTRLRPGDTLRLRLLEGGRPRPGLPVACANAARGGRTFATTDAEGRIALRLEHPGPWLLAATVLRRVDRADVEWQSDFATLTFAVGKP